MFLPAARILPAAPRTLNLREYERRRNRVLIHRQIGGLGDILMHRMLFEDLHLLGLEVHFACPVQYHPAVADHPYLDVLWDCNEVDPFAFLASYNTTTACGRYEMHIAPRADLHRSDIWAKHCGFDLTRHQMHLTLTDAERAEGERLVRGLAPGRAVCLCPKSAMASKDLGPRQIAPLVAGLRERGFAPFGLHRDPVWELEACGVPVLSGISLRAWMAVIDRSEAVISVDTGSFHCAGGLGKPLVGVFTWADGKVYGQYFDFALVQKHRDDGDWDCGPCYDSMSCPKSRGPVKPCLTEISGGDILAGFDRLLEGRLLS